MGRGVLHNGKISNAYCVTLRTYRTARHRPSASAQFLEMFGPANRIFRPIFRPAANFSADYGQHFSGGISAYFG